MLAAKQSYATIVALYFYSVFQLGIHPGRKSEPYLNQKRFKACWIPMSTLISHQDVFRFISFHSSVLIATVDAAVVYGLLLAL